MYITLLPDILYGHHGQVVTLFGVTDELVYGLSHLTDQQTGFLLMVSKRTHSNFVDALLQEHVFIGIHSLRESVGKEEDGGVSGELCLFHGILPLGHETYGDV